MNITTLQAALEAQARRNAVRHALVQSLRTVRADLPEEIVALLKADELAGENLASVMGRGE